MGYGVLPSEALQAEASASGASAGSTRPNGSGGVNEPVPRYPTSALEGGVRELLARNASSGCVEVVPRKQPAEMPATKRSSRDAYGCVRRFATSPWD